MNGSDNKFFRTCICGEESPTLNDHYAHILKCKEQRKHSDLDNAKEFLTTISQLKDENEALKLQLILDKGLTTEGIQNP